MSRIGVISSLSFYGGAEKLSLEVVRALREAGHTVDLIVVRKINRMMAAGIFGFDACADTETVSPPYVPIPSTQYSRFVLWLFRDAMFVPYFRKKWDLTITTQPLLPIVFTDVIYMHFLEFPGMIQIYYPRYRRGLWRAYLLPHDMMLKFFLAAYNRLDRKPLILTNSLFSKQVIERYLRATAIVVYPPVAVEDYIPLSRHRKEEGLILVVSRIAPDKGLDIVPQIAAKVKSARFVILGYLQSRAYLEHLRWLVSSLGVEDRVRILPNATEDKKRALLERAGIYLHTMAYEHFGIPVVEAMAAGAIPVVPRSGGPWIDILNKTQGVYGYAYEDLSSCVEVLEHILHSGSSRKQMVERITERSKVFSSAVFRRNMVSITNELLRSRQQGRKQV